MSATWDSVREYPTTVGIVPLGYGITNFALGLSRRDKDPPCLADHNTSVYFFVFSTSWLMYNDRFLASQESREVYHHAERAGLRPCGVALLSTN
jgi:hypothetical protein